MDSLTPLPHELLHSLCFADNEGFSDHEIAHKAFNTAFSLRLTSKELAEIISGAFFCGQFFSKLKPERLFAAPYPLLENPCWKTLLQKYFVLDNWIKNTPSITRNPARQVPNETKFFGDENGVYSLTFTGMHLFHIPLAGNAHPLPPLDLPTEVFECFQGHKINPTVLNDHIVWLNPHTKTLFLCSPEKKWLGPFTCQEQPLAIIESNLIVYELNQLSIFDIQNPKLEPKTCFIENITDLHIGKNHIVGLFNNLSLCGMQTAQFIHAVKEGKSLEWLSAGSIDKHYPPNIRRYDPAIYNNEADAFVFSVSEEGIIIDRIDFEEKTMHAVLLGKIANQGSTSYQRPISYYAGRFFFGHIDMADQSSGLNTLDIQTWKLTSLTSGNNELNCCEFWHHPTFSKINCVVMSALEKNLVHVETIDYS